MGFTWHSESFPAPKSSCIQTSQESPFVLNLVVQLFPPYCPRCHHLPSCHQPVLCRASVTAECPSAHWHLLSRGPGEGSSSRKEQHRVSLALCVCPGWLWVRRWKGPCAVLPISGCRGTVCPVSHCPCPAHPQVAFPGVPQGCQRGWSVRRREGSQSPSQLLTALKNPGNVSFRHLKAVMGFFPQNRNKRISLIAESPPD